MYIGTYTYGPGGTVLFTPPCKSRGSNGQVDRDVAAAAVETRNLRTYLPFVHHKTFDLAVRRLCGAIEDIATELKTHKQLDKQFQQRILNNLSSIQQDIDNNDKRDAQRDQTIAGQDVDIHTNATQLSSLSGRFTSAQADLNVYKNSAETQRTEIKQSIHTLAGSTTQFQTTVSDKLVAMEAVQNNQQTVLSAKIQTVQTTLDAQLQENKANLATLAESTTQFQTTAAGKLEALKTTQTTMTGRLRSIETTQDTAAGKLKALKTTQTTMAGRLGSIETAQDTANLASVSHKESIDDLEHIQEQLADKLVSVFGEQAFDLDGTSSKLTPEEQTKVKAFWDHVLGRN